MSPILRIAILLAAAASPLMGGTVLVTSLPDAARPLGPLASFDGLALPAGSEVRIGAFPGMSDDEILDVARSGGLAQISAVFTPFGVVCSIGEGADGQAGNFEISVREAVAAGSPLESQEISVLIRKDAGEEFLVARFKGKHFEVDPETGLEPLISLHLAEAKVIAGDRYGSKQISTAPPTDAGSFSEWIARFSGLDEDDQLSGADPDSDGRVNFLEYATAGNPSSGVGESGCTLVKDGSGNFRVRFSRAVGIGAVPTVEWSPDLLMPWVALDGNPTPDPEMPALNGVQWLTLPVPESVGTQGFFRLNMTSGQ